MKFPHIKWPEQWQKKKLLAKAVSYSTKDFIVAMVLYLCCVVMCLGLRQFDPHNDSSYVAMIFLLDVFLTALLTDGYLFSLLMAIAGVLSVDYIFTPPYWAISFTVAGFPLTFLVMLSISIATGTITSRAKEMEAVKREAERERIHANLLRAVSHDIRTPLTGIVGATNVLLEQDDLTPQQRRELLENANQDAQWLIRIVENLLSVTRIGPGEQAHLNKVPAAVEEIIESALVKFRKRYPDVALEVSLPRDEVPVAPVDELLMEQVLINLLENAVIHGVTTTRIRVALRQEGGSVLITVEDNGQGIAAARLEHLWSGSFQNVSQGDKKRNMGIGLRMCKTVVEAHGGTITGENKKEGGARFTVALPTEGDTNENQG